MRCRRVWRPQTRVLATCGLLGAHVLAARGAETKHVRQILPILNPARAALGQTLVGIVATRCAGGRMRCHRRARARAQALVCARDKAFAIDTRVAYIAGGTHVRGVRATTK